MLIDESPYKQKYKTKPDQLSVVAIESRRVCLACKT